MKPFYKHNYDKVVVPFFVKIHDMWFSEEDYDSLKDAGFGGVGASVTIVREPSDDESCLPVSFSIADVDVDVRSLSGYVLFKERIISACEDYIMSNEDEIVNSERVKVAFAWLDEEKRGR